MGNANGKWRTLNGVQKNPLKAWLAIFWFCLSRIQLKLFALSCVCFERTIKMQFGRAASTQSGKQWSRRMQSARRAANSTPGPRRAGKNERKSAANGGI